MLGTQCEVHEIRLLEPDVPVVTLEAHHIYLFVATYVYSCLLRAFRRTVPDILSQHTIIHTTLNSTTAFHEHNLQ
jgi:hypothetical protein